MKHAWCMCCLVLSIVLCVEVSGSQERRYYLELTADACASPDIEVRGATNLPTASLIQLSLADEHRDATGARHQRSDLFQTAVDGDGFFHCRLRAKSAQPYSEFVVAVIFVPSPEQPQEVLAAVGLDGKNLGDSSNPQLGRDSEGHSYLGQVVQVDRCSRLPNSATRECKLCRQLTKEQKKLLGAVVFTQMVRGSIAAYEAIASTIMNRMESGDRQWVQKGQQLTLENVLNKPRQYKGIGGLRFRRYLSGEASRDQDAQRVRLAVENLVRKGPSTNAISFLIPGNR